MKYLNRKTASKLFFTGILLLTGAIILSSNGVNNTTMAQLQRNVTADRGRLSETSLDEIIKNAKVETNITHANSTSSYIATATGRGTIPSGEYAGRPFTVRVNAAYSAEGDGTLISANALVKITGVTNFGSVRSPIPLSFCCGSGHLHSLGSTWNFTVWGQVRHITAAGDHNHLFRAHVSTTGTTGTMSMTISDQKGTVVTPSHPPHDPGIGIVDGIRAKPATVKMR